jgi:hypothetical protein
MITGGKGRNVRKYNAAAHKVENARIRAPKEQHLTSNDSGDSHVLLHLYGT